MGAGMDSGGEILKAVMKTVVVVVVVVVSAGKTLDYNVAGKC